MPKTIAEAIAALEDLRHSRSVWMNVVEHISKYLDTEVQKAEYRLVSEECVSGFVPQKAIKDFVNHIEENEISPLSYKITSIENYGVTEEEEEEEDIYEEPTHPKSNPRKKAAKKQNKLAKNSTIRKRIGVPTKKGVNSG